MKKIIAAIFAVICVHIGFSALVATEPAADQTAAAVRKLAETDQMPSSPIADVDEVPEARPMLASVANEREFTPPAVRVVERIVYVPAPRAARAVDRTPNAAAMPRNATVAMIQPVVITPRSIPLSADIGEKRTVAVVTNPKKSEKRSLVAKAMPIIKKPWDWLKFVGSRLK